LIKFSSKLLFCCSAVLQFEKNWPSLCTIQDGKQTGKHGNEDVDAKTLKEYPRRPASVSSSVSKLKAFSVPMHRSSGPRLTALCWPRP
jgi:hypothetical protein